MLFKIKEEEINIDNFRVKFYSEHDFASGYNLEKAEEVLLNYSETYKYNDINEIIEFYNIQLYFDAEIYLKKWDTTNIKIYSEISNKTEKNVGLFFSMIDDDNIIEIYKKINNDYIDNFWTLYNKFRLYTRISQEKFEEVLKYNLNLSYIIVHNKVVNTYDEIIGEIMMDNLDSCELILDEYLALKSKNIKYFFPVNLDKNKLIEMYIDSDVYNLNYIHLIAVSTSVSDLNIPDKLRLKAIRKYTQESNKIFEGYCYTSSFGVEVAFPEEQDNLVEVSNNNMILRVSYDKKQIEECLEYPMILIYNFIYLFNYLDNEARFCHVHKLNEMSSFTNLLGVKGNREYTTNIVFKQRQLLAQFQMIGFYKILADNQIVLEDVCRWFFEDYLEAEFKVTGFFFNSPSVDSTYLEKNRTLNSEIDSVLKQYTMWCEEGLIVNELLQISSNHLFFENIPSLISKKYVYPNSEEYNIASYLLCSDQSPIKYISKKINGSNFRTLLNTFDLTMSKFRESQKVQILWLLDHSYIYEDDNGYLKCETNTVKIIEDLYFNEVLAYHHVDKLIQKQVDVMLEKKIIKSEDSLFSKPEQKYLNYICNKRKFSNGLDLRNKYIHGTQSQDSSVHENDYYIILRILVLCILKINDEFCLEYNLKQM